MVELCLLILPTAGLARTNAASRRRLFRHPLMVTNCLSKGHGQPESKILTIPMVQTGGLKRTGKCRRLGSAPVTPRLPETAVIRLFYGLSLVGFVTRVKAIMHKLFEMSHDQARASLLEQSEMLRLGRQNESLSPCFPIILLPSMSSPPQLILYLSPRSRRSSFCFPTRITIYPALPPRTIPKGNYSLMRMAPRGHSLSQRPNTAGPGREVTFSIQLHQDQQPRIPALALRFI